MHIRSASNTNEVNWDDPLNKGLVAWMPFKSVPGLTASFASPYKAIEDIAGGHHFRATTSSGSVISVIGPSGGQRLGWFGSSAGGHQLEARLDITDWSAISFAVWIQKKGNFIRYNRCFSVLHSGADDIRIYPEDVGLQSLSLRFDDGTASADLPTPDLSDGWHHLAGTHDGSTIKFFLNGISVGETSYTFNYSGAAGNTCLNHLKVSAGSTAKQQDANYSDTRIYNRALSESEVHDLYQASRTGYQDQFKRRYFPVSLQTEEPPAETATSGLIRLKSPRQSEPSYKAGYAKSASESANPELWDGLQRFYAPMMGNTGEKLIDISPSSVNALPGGAMPSWSTTDGFGSVSSFDGSTQWLNTGLLWSQDDKDVTIFALCNPKASNVNISTNYYTSSPRDFIQFSIIDGDVRMRVRDVNNNMISALKNGSFYNSGFYSLAGWYSHADRSASVAINGVVSATATNNSVTGDFSSAAPLAIVGNPGPTPTASGACDIAAFGIWNRVLSPQEIQQLYTDPLAPFRQRRYAPVSLPTEEPTFNNWYARPGRTNRIVGSGVHV